LTAESAALVESLTELSAQQQGGLAVYADAARDLHAGAAARRGAAWGLDGGQGLGGAEPPAAAARGQPRVGRVDVLVLHDVSCRRVHLLQLDRAPPCLAKASLPVAAARHPVLRTARGLADRCRQSRGRRAPLLEHAGAAGD
jgi:hypothetical protein